MSAWLHLASCCCRMVLPVPKSPGMAPAPPRAMGKKVSMTRWPVTRISVLERRRAKGRARRIGQRCVMVSSCVPVSVSSVQTVCVIGYSPSAAMSTTLPLSPGGTCRRWAISSVSWTLPKTWPPASSAPSWTTGLKGHLRCGVQRVGVDAGLQEGAGEVGQGGERALDAVEDAAQQPGGEHGRERGAGALHLHARPQAARVLVDLDGGHVAGQLDDLPDEALGADPDQLEGAGRGQPLGLHDGSADADDPARHVACFTH